MLWDPRLTESFKPNLEQSKRFEEGVVKHRRCDREQNPSDYEQHNQLIEVRREYT